MKQWEYRVSWGEQVKSQITRCQETLLKWHSLLAWAGNHGLNDQQESQETGQVLLAKGRNPVTESGTKQHSPVVLRAPCASEYAPMRLESSCTYL